MLDVMLDRLRRRLALTLRRHPLLPFLLAATVAGDVVLSSSEVRKYQEIVIPASFAQIGLLGVWAGQLRRGWLLRCAVALAGSSAVCLVLFRHGNRPPLNEVLTVLLSYGVGVAVVGAVSRLVGRTINRLRRGDSAEPVRFSIWGILATTTAVAVGLSLLRFADFPGDNPLAMILGCGSLGLLPLIAYEIVRRTTRLWLAVVGVMIAVVGCAVVFLSVAGGRIDSLDWYLAILCQGVFYLIWLLGLRSRTRRPPITSRA